MWYCYLIRMEESRLFKTVTEWKPEGKTEEERDCLCIGGYEQIWPSIKKH